MSDSDEEINKLKNMIEKQGLEILRLKGVINNLPGSIYWKDVDGVYLGNNKFANNKMANLNLNESVINKTDYDLFGKEVADKFRKNDLEVMGNNCELSKEEVITLPDGKKVVQLSTKKPLHDNVGNVIGIVGNTVDITELREAQDKIKNIENRLAGMISLSASIAHELRTPLTAIQFGISGAKDYLPTLVKAYTIAREHQLAVDQIQRRHLQILSSVFDTIESEINYADTIINIILMNLQKNKGIFEIDFKVQSMNSCIEEAIRRYPLKKRERKIIKWFNDNDFLFNGEKILMVHVFFNLFKNALYFIKAEQKGEIQIGVESDEQNNIVYFKDTAKGIPEDVLPKLFEKFYSTTRHGTGLGLSYCKMVITGFGGTISCQSKYGEFTLFKMTFPKLKRSTDTNKKYYKAHLTLI
jgi:signal transduction histidine kinase